MRCLIGFALLAALLLFNSGANGQTGQDRILSQFPQCHIVKLEDRDPETRSFIVQHFPKSDASVIHADLDGDAYRDYALLLKTDHSAETKLVIAFCSEQDQCKIVYDQGVGDAGQLYIRAVPIGSKVRETDAGSTPSTRLRSPGVELNYFEKAAVVYYWNKKSGKIEIIETED